MNPEAKPSAHRKMWILEARTYQLSGATVTRKLGRLPIRESVLEVNKWIDGDGLGGGREPPFSRSIDVANTIRSMRAPFSCTAAIAQKVRRRSSRLKPKDSSAPSVSSNDVLQRTVRRQRSMAAAFIQSTGWMLDTPVRRILRADRGTRCSVHPWRFRRAIGAEARPLRK